MKRLAMACCATAALAWAMPAAAQTYGSSQQNMSNQKQITVTGCLEQNKSGGFWLTNATPSPATAPTAKSQTATGTSGTMSNTSKDISQAIAWNLKGGNNLDSHLGQKVSVKGQAKDDTSGDQLKSASGSEQQQARDFDVSSVKMIASTCGG
ncbi:MAG TPA: hypothetical protein VFX12_07840 [Vicinamibacterales bacterium]|nr:hypothetical protein [Vicinamibacterales bacterium]